MLRAQSFGWDERLALAEAADQIGISRLWVGESYGSDAMAELAAYATRTSRVALASGVVGVFGRTPASLAQAAITIDSISQGRFSLGLGTSSSTLARHWHGVNFSDASQRLRETMEIIRMIVEREPLVYSGRIFSFNRGIRTPTASLRSRIPIYIGALAPKGLCLTGELADGWLGAFVSPDHFAEVFAPDLEHGLEGRHDGLDPLEICVYQTVVVCDDYSDVRAAARPSLARYIGVMGSQERNYYARLFRRYGFEQEVSRIQELYLERRRELAEAAVSDEMIDLVTISGCVEECRHRLLALKRIGADEVALDLVIPRASLDGYVAALAEFGPSRFESLRGSEA